MLGRYQCGLERPSNEKGFAADGLRPSLDRFFISLHPSQRDTNILMGKFGDEGPKRIGGKNPGEGYSGALSLILCISRIMGGVSP